MSTCVLMVLRTPSSLKSADWVNLIGSLGIYIIESSNMAVEYKSMWCNYLRWMATLRGHTVNHRELLDCEQEAPFIFNDLECRLPMYAATINHHVTFHLPRWVRHFGTLGAVAM